MGNILSFTLYHIRNHNNACPITADAEFNPLEKNGNHQISPLQNLLLSLFEFNKQSKG